LVEGERAMTAVTIKDELEGWSQEVGEQDLWRLAIRNVLRMLPHIQREVPHSQRAAVYMFRSALVGGVITQVSRNDIDLLRNSARLCALLCVEFDSDNSIDLEVSGGFDANHSHITPLDMAGKALDAMTKREGATSAEYAVIVSSGFYPEVALVDAKSQDHWGPLWLENAVPSVIQNTWASLQDLLMAEPEKWAFWLEWYEAILEGRPLPWDLSFAIATQITEADWEKEPRIIHDRILEIREAWEQARRTESVPDLEAEALSRHVRTLLKDPEMTALTAEGAAELLERAMAEYCNASHQNRLPEALSHLEGLPPIFRRIAHLVKAEGKAKTAEAKLRAEIEALNAKVAELEADLKAARAKSVHGLFTQAMITAMCNIYIPAVVGGTGLAVCHFFGVSVSDLTLENLRGFLEEVEKATPAPSDTSAVPPVIDV